MPEQTAQLNYLKIAPRKVRIVADLVKGLSVNEAEAQLMFMRRRAAQPLLKLLRSAVANAKNNKNLNQEILYVKTFTVDGGPMLKRYLPRARGMATPIQKKMSNVTIVLSENPKAVSPRFKIVVPKKTKLPPEMTKKTSKKKKQVSENKTEQQPKKSGFFKKMFSRKSGVSNAK